MRLDLTFLTLPTSVKRINTGGIKRRKKYSKEKMMILAGIEADILFCCI